MKASTSTEYGYFIGVRGLRGVMCAMALSLCAATQGMAKPAKNAGVADLLCPVVKAEKPAKPDKAAKKEKGEKAAPAKKVKTDGKEAKQMASLAKMLKTIAAGGDINAVDKNGQSALMFAASLGNRSAVCWLVAKGADVTLKAKSGKTAADLARDVRSRDLLEACAREKEPLSEEEKYYCNVVEGQNSPEDLSRVIGEPWVNSIRNCALKLRAGADANLMLARVLSYRGMYSAERIAYILRNLPDDKKPKTEDMIDPGMAYSMPEETVRLIVALGYKPDMKDAKPEQKFRYAQKTGNIAQARQILAANADLEKSAKWSTKMPEDVSSSPNALMKAIMDHDVAGVRAMLAAGAPVNATEQGYTPLSRAIITVFRFLGDNPYASAMIEASTALDLNLCTGDVYVSYKKGEGLPMPPAAPIVSLSTEVYGNAAEIVDVLLAAGADPAAEVKGETPLGLALQNLTRAVAINSISSQQIPYETYAAIIHSLIKAKSPVPKDALLRMPMGLRYGVAPEVCADIAEALLKAGADPKATNTDGCTALMTAGSYSPALTKKLLKAGVNPKAATSDGWTALHSAQTPEVAALLLKAGADAGATTTFKNRGTALENTIKMSCSPQLAEHVSLLLKAKSGAPKDAMQNLAQRSPLDVSFAVFEATAKELTAAGADANTCWEGNYPVKTLVAVGAKVDAYPGGVKALLTKRPNDIDDLVKYGADINAQDPEGNTPLMLAVRKHDATRIEKLLQLGAKTDVADSKGDTPEKLAMKDTAALLALIRAGAKLPFTNELLNKALNMCSEKELKEKDCKTVEKLITSLLDKNSGVSVPTDALLRLEGEKTISSSHEDRLLKAHIELNSAAARALLNAGADPKAVGPNGRTTLMATCFCDEEITKRLLDSGVDAKAKNKDGLTALHFARSAQAVNLLLKAGADANATIKTKRYNFLRTEQAEVDCNPLVYSLAFNHWNKKEQLEVVQALIKGGSKVKGDGWDALFEAGVSGCISAELVPVLTRAGANPAARDEKGRTWLMLHPLAITFIDDSFGYDINAQDKEGMTALMYLAINFKPIPTDLYGDFVKSYINKGAKTDLRTKDGKTLYQLVNDKLGDVFTYELRRVGIKE